MLSAFPCGASNTKTTGKKENKNNYFPSGEGDNEDENEDDEQNETDEHSKNAKRQAVPFPGPQVMAGVPSSPFAQGVPAQLSQGVSISLRIRNMSLLYCAETRYAR